MLKHKILAAIASCFLFAPAMADTLPSNFSGKWVYVKTAHLADRAKLISGYCNQYDDFGNLPGSNTKFELRGLDFNKNTFSLNMTENESMHFMVDEYKRIKLSTNRPNEISGTAWIYDIYDYDLEEQPVPRKETFNMQIKNGILMFDGYQFQRCK